jgi:pimeloyl-ACP methyl ester carboxylesterase
MYRQLTRLMPVAILAASLCLLSCKKAPKTAAVLMSPATTTATFNYSGTVRISYEVRGSGSVTLVMLHGFGASLETWRDIQPFLEPRYRLVLVDMKGFGNSSKPEDNAYSILDQTAIITALCKSLDLKDYVLIGHSYGGAVALATYLTNHASGSPNPVRSLVLIDPPWYVQKFPLFIKMLRTGMVNHISLNLLSSRTRTKYILNQVFLDKSKVTPERIDRYAKYLDLPGSHHALIASARQIIPANPTLFSSRTHEVAVPTLILWGANDTLIPKWQGERLHKEIRDSQFVVFAKCGHVPQEEQPEETAQKLIEFIH